ncbi:amidohydrolase family protein [Pleomorphochaeta sp. DL1XJH-081]|uniref:amidohydrolase family protein n=1 Tax=Pleomorphochaeta sp. DL1XJH-081 TaxID=3409690 RepID=UPI003BB80E9A
MQWKKCKNGMIVFLLGIMLLMTSCFSGPRAVRVELPDLKMAQVTQAFVHANVIPMTEPDMVLENAIVVIEGNTITYVGTDYDRIPKSADVIDCSGKWIVPGLADAHVHLLFNSLDPLLFLANGVTSVRNMASLTDSGRDDTRFAFNVPLEFRDSTQRGDVLSPWVYQASPIHEARTGKYFDRSLYLDINSAEAGKRAVQIASEKGFDYFKIYNKLPRTAFFSVVEEAEKFDLPVVGHVPHEVAIEEVIEGSLMHSIEHLTGYINPFGKMKFSLDRLDDYAELSAVAGIWNVPTLEVWKNIVTPDHIDDIDSDPWTRYISASNRKIWSGSINSFSSLIKRKVDGYSILPSEHIKDFELIVKALIEADAPIAAGTDSGTLNVVAGTSLHKELESFVELGMTPWEALASSTSHAAECFGKANEFGSIQAGFRADLLVLDNNPLKDISHLRDINLVVVQGIPYKQSELIDILDQLVLENTN